MLRWFEVLQLLEEIVNLRRKSALSKKSADIRPDPADD